MSRSSDVNNKVKEFLSQFIYLSNLYCYIKTYTIGIFKDDTKWSEFMRFAMVGFLATGLHYGIYLLLLNPFHANLAYTFGYGVSLMMNFFLSNIFTFKTKPTFKKGLGFIVSHGINYLLHILLLNLFLWIGLRKQLAPIPVYAIVVPVNFLLVRTVLKSKKM